jgi:hypothetical protein
MRGLLGGGRVFAAARRVAVARVLQATRRAAAAPLPRTRVLLTAAATPSWLTRTAAPLPVCRYWANAEAGYLDFATYYGLPMVSLKAGCYHLLRKGLPGYKTGDTRRWGRRCALRCPRPGWGGGGAERRGGAPGQQGWAGLLQRPCSSGPGGCSAAAPPPSRGPP